MLYKVLDNGRSFHGGNFEWPLPTQGEDGEWTPGEWVEVSGPLKICERGLHLTAEPGRWYNWDCAVWAAEGAGESQTADDKTVFHRARLLHPAPHPQWWMDAKAFVAAIGQVSYFKLGGGAIPSGIQIFRTRAAATAAARDAARAAAGTAAVDAAWAAAGAAARDAARAAAVDAAGDAAWDAARVAAWAAAALSAAGDAAWDAAWDAARDAAGTAAVDAAWDAGLMARCLIVADKIDAGHIAHARLRMAAWEAGLGVLCDINGVIYAYEWSEK